MSGRAREDELEDAIVLICEKVPWWCEQTLTFFGDRSKYVLLDLARLKPLRLNCDELRSIIGRCAAWRA